MCTGARQGSTSLSCRHSGRKRYKEFRVLSYVVSSRPAWATWDPVSTTTTSTYHIKDQSSDSSSRAQLLEATPEHSRAHCYLRLSQSRMQYTQTHMYRQLHTSGSLVSDFVCFLHVFIHVCMCIHIRVHMHALARMWGSENNSQGLGSLPSTVRVLGTELGPSGLAAGAFTS